MEETFDPGLRIPERPRRQHRLSLELDSHEPEGMATMLRSLAAMIEHAGIEALNVYTPNASVAGGTVVYSEGPATTREEHARRVREWSDLVQAAFQGSESAGGDS